LLVNRSVVFLQPPLKILELGLMQSYALLLPLLSEHMKLCRTRKLANPTLSNSFFQSSDLFSFTLLKELHLTVYE